MKKTLVALMLCLVSITTIAGLFDKVFGKEPTTNDLSFYRETAVEIRAQLNGKYFCGSVESPKGDLIDILCCNNYGIVTDIYLYHPHPNRSKAQVAAHFIYYPNLGEWRNASYYNEGGREIGKAEWTIRYWRDFSNRMSKSENSLWVVLFKNKNKTLYPMCVKE